MGAMPMIRTTVWLLSGLLIAALAVTGATATAPKVKLPGIEFDRYHALVIGINDYQYMQRLGTAMALAGAADAPDGTSR